MEYVISGSVRTLLVKEWRIEAKCVEDALTQAEGLASQDLETGNLDGWDMASDSRPDEVSVDVDWDRFVETNL